MLAKIIAAAAASVRLTGNALASGSTVSGLHNLVNSNQSVYASHSNSRGHRYAAAPAPNGYKDTQGSHALGGGPG